MKAGVVEANYYSLTTTRKRGLGKQLSMTRQRPRGERRGKPKDPTGEANFLKSPVRTVAVLLLMNRQDQSEVSLLLWLGYKATKKAVDACWGRRW